MVLRRFLIAELMWVTGSSLSPNTSFIPPQSQLKYSGGTVTEVNVRVVQRLLNVAVSATVFTWHQMM
jgi:hypothetical protein